MASSTGTELEEVINLKWIEIPEDKKEEIREALRCPKCSEPLELITKSVPLFGGAHMAYCNSCDSAFIDEGSIPVGKEEEWKKAQV